MTQSQANGSTVVQEKHRHDTLDAFFEVMRMLTVALWVCHSASSSRMFAPFAFVKQVPLSLFKADIDAAFRRIPLIPQHRAYATVAFMHAGTMVILQHMAAPFGAISSVHHWERIGKASHISPLWDVSLVPFYATQAPCCAH